MLWPEEALLAYITQVFPKYLTLSSVAGHLLRGLVKKRAPHEALPESNDASGSLLLRETRNTHQ